MRFQNDEERLRRCAELDPDDVDAVSLVRRGELRRRSDFVSYELQSFVDQLAPWTMSIDSVQWLHDRYRELISKHGVDKAGDYPEAGLPWFARRIRGCLDDASGFGKPSFAWPNLTMGRFGVVGGVYATAHELVVGLTLATFDHRGTTVSITDPGVWNVLMYPDSRRLANGWFKTRMKGPRRRRTPVQDRLFFDVYWTTQQLIRTDGRGY
jgi:hypothetical protein